MAHTLKTVGHYTRVIHRAKKQLAALPSMSLSDSDNAALQGIYFKQIKTATHNRDTAMALNITVIDPIYL